MCRFIDNETVSWSQVHLIYITENHKFALKDFTVCPTDAILYPQIFDSEKKTSHKNTFNGEKKLKKERPNYKISHKSYKVK